MKPAAHEIRKRLLSWGPGDKQRVEGLWGFNATPEMVGAVNSRADLYAARFRSDPRTRLEFEARVDVLAMKMHKAPTQFLGWLRDFDEAATEIVNG